MDLNDPIAVALATAEALGRAHLEAALYGGLVLAAYGEPRETKDADMAVAGMAAKDALTALRQAGLLAQIAFEDAKFGGLRISRITLLGGEGASGLNVVDLVEPRSERYARAALGRTIAGELRGLSIRLLSPEDFVVFKVLSSRDRDVEDATLVTRALGDRLDRALVARECAALALEIPDHDVQGRLGRIQAAAAASDPRR